ncbi:double zinc ribbon domain-containing protein, partial [Candidatus Hodarchaeum mangrovi]
TVPESTFVVPSSGTWYFFVYLDPFVNPDYSVEITFDVSYETGVTHTDRWTDFRPILLVIGAIIVIILIIALIQRRSRKSQPPDTTTVTPVTPSTAPSADVVTTSSSGQCQRCRYDYRAGDIYCKNCGAKLIGRDYGSSNVTTPASSNNCTSCGQTIIPGSKYCKHCGAKVITEKGYSYFPDERKSFYCQLDGSKHPSTDSAYQCTQCSRMICKNCYDDLSRTEVSVCPYCKGSLHQIQ